MKKTIALSMLLAVSIGANAAGAPVGTQITPMQAFGNGFIALLPVGVGYLAASRGDGPACQNGPMHTVVWKNNPTGYKFTVPNCDFESKKGDLAEVN